MPWPAAAEEKLLLGIQRAALVTHMRRTYYSDQGRLMETADIVVPAAHCEIVYAIPPPCPLPCSVEQETKGRTYSSESFTCVPGHVEQRIAG